MTLEHQTTVKSWFQRGKAPTQSQFASFIESSMPEWQINLEEHAQGGGSGILEVLSAVSATVHTPGAVGLQVLQTASTAAAQAVLALASAADAVAQNFTRGAAGAVTRTVGSRLSDTWNVREFGAIGNGTTDDTASFRSALAAIETTAAALWIPGGTYRLEGAVTASGKSVHIFGEGTGISVLKWSSSATSAGFVFRSSSKQDSNYSHFNDLTFMTAQLSAAITGLILDYKAQVVVSGSTAGQDRIIFDRISPRFLIDNCSFIGVTAATGGGWQNGIDVNCGMNGTIRNCSFVGQLGGLAPGFGNPYPWSESAITVHGVTDNYANGHPVSFDIGGCKVYYYRVGVFANQCEGVYVHDNVLVAVGYGAVFTGTTSPPHATMPYMTFIDNDCGVFLSGVLATDVTDVKIRGNEIFARAESSAAAVFGAVIRSTNGIASDVSIYSNSFHNQNSRPFIGVATEGSRRVTIGDNIFDFTGTAITLGANAAGVATQQTVVDHQNTFNNVTTRYTVASAASNFIGAEVSAVTVGHMDLASGIQVRWGSVVAGVSAGASTISFTKPFDTAAFMVQLTNGDIVAAGRDITFGVGLLNQVGFTFTALTSGSLVNNTVRINYIAYGN